MFCEYLHNSLDFAPPAAKPKILRGPYRVWPPQGFTSKRGARWDSHTWRVHPPTSLGWLPGSPSLGSSVTSSKRPPSLPAPHLKEFTSTSRPRPGFTSLKPLTLPVNLLNPLITGILRAASACGTEAFRRWAGPSPNVHLQIQKGPKCIQPNINSRPLILMRWTPERKLWHRTVTAPGSGRTGIRTGAGWDSPRLRTQVPRRRRS